MGGVEGVDRMGLCLPGDDKMVAKIAARGRLFFLLVSIRFWIKGI